MNIERSRNFIKTHKDQVINLFITYQIIEMLLFLKLHLPGLSEAEESEDYLNEVNTKINSKTFGKLKRVYLEKYPNDKHGLEFDLEVVENQRNSFMHSFCTVLSLWEDESAMNAWGTHFLNDFVTQADSLLEKIRQMS